MEASMNLSAVEYKGTLSAFWELTVSLWQPCLITVPSSTIPSQEQWRGRVAAGKTGKLFCHILAEIIEK
jgi:hypothetical protein